MNEFVCPQCESRPLYRLRGGRVVSRCGECRAANQSLARYWAKLGMPLPWRGSSHQRRNWLSAVFETTTP